MEDSLLEVGDFVEAQWLEPTNGSLAGVQPKVAAKERYVAGKVISIRGDDPVSPTKVMILVQPIEQPLENAVWVDIIWVIQAFKNEKNL